MKLYTYPITVKREKGSFYAYSEDFPGVYGLGKVLKKPKPVCSME
jgi:predicted RNase H-like HicB family nuclease